MHIIFWGVGFLLACVLALVTAVFIKDARRARLQKRIDPSYEWHFHRKDHLDLMRRRSIEGEWQYRAMTHREHQQYIADRW